MTDEIDFREVEYLNDWMTVYADFVQAIVDGPVEPPHANVIDVDYLPACREFSQRFDGPDTYRELDLDPGETRRFVTQWPHSDEQSSPMPNGYHGSYLSRAAGLLFNSYTPDDVDVVEAPAWEEINGSGDVEVVVTREAED